MSVEKRDILAPSAIEPYDNSVYQSAEDLHCTEPSSAGANGDSTAHGDVAGWGAASARAGKVQNTDGAAGFAL